MKDYLGDAMKKNSLRDKIIRLAHQKPELRKHLLPLVTNKTAISKISVDMEDVSEAVSDAVYHGRPQWNVDGDYDIRWLQYGILIKSRVEFVIKGDVSGIYAQRDFGMGERFLIVSDNKGKAQKECEKHAIDSLYSTFSDYDVPFNIVSVKSRMVWLEDTGNGACSLEITCK